MADIKTQVKVEFDTEKVETMIAKHLNENAQKIAKQIEADAKASVPVVTGNLKRGIKAKKSRYEDGGWIVQSTAPHAHLLEFGTVKMSAKPYLRPALRKNISAARAAFGAK